MEDFNFIEGIRVMNEFSFNLYSGKLDCYWQGYRKNVEECLNSTQRKMEVEFDLDVKLVRNKLTRCLTDFAHKHFEQSYELIINTHIWRWVIQHTIQLHSEEGWLFEDADIASEEIFKELVRSIEYQVFGRKAPVNDDKFIVI